MCRLEARNLCKEYKVKNGPVTNALDNVSVKFEETGMVFIHGKSTLLNVGIRQVLLMFGISILVAFISSYLPVRSIAKKKLIDAIRSTN